MHLLLFKVFRDLAETASFSQAAQLNGITQSAVSQQVKALEKRHGVRLIERGKKSFSLTAEGVVFLGASREILGVVDGLERRLRELSEVISGDLPLAAVLSVGLHELPPFTRQFTRLYPQVKIRTDYLRSAEVYAAVLAGRAEAGLVAFPAPRRGLESEVLWRDTETRSPAVLVDTLTKLASIGVPLRFLLERYGLSPQTLDRVMRMTVEEPAVEEPAPEEAASLEE
jgi:DNA-binding transcriptional LysR family regulator